MARIKDRTRPSILVSGEQLRRFYGALNLETMEGELIQRENPDTRDNPLLDVKRIPASVLMPRLEKLMRGPAQARGWKRNREKREAQKARDTQKIREANAELAEATGCSQSVACSAE